MILDWNFLKNTFDENLTATEYTPHWLYFSLWNCYVCSLYSFSLSYFINLFCFKFFFSSNTLVMLNALSRVWKKEIPRKGFFSTWLWKHNYVNVVFHFLRHSTCCLAFDSFSSKLSFVLWVKMHFFKTNAKQFRMPDKFIHEDRTLPEHIITYEQTKKVFNLWLGLVKLIKGFCVKRIFSCNLSGLSFECN